MNSKKVRKAIKKAKKLIKAADEVKGAERVYGDRLLYITGSNETGKLKRVSMELSEALVDLRRAG